MSTDLIDFLLIKEKFLQFLEDDNNVYKYQEQYINYINCINNSISDSIEEHLIMFILFIQKEKGTCRIHNNKNERLIEKEVIIESQKILKKYKTSKILNINTILNFEKNIIYKNTIEYGSNFDNVLFEPITDINKKNLYSILENLQNINRLRKINNCKIYDNLQKTINYLLCFYYFQYDIL